MKKLNLMMAISLLTTQGFTEEAEKKLLDNSKKYSACNQWLQNEYPGDKQFSLNPETGEVLKGENATQHFSQSNNKKNTQISFANKSKDDRNTTEILDIDILQNEDNTITIERRTKVKNSFPAASGWGMGGVQNLQQVQAQQQLIQQQQQAQMNGGYNSNFKNTQLDDGTIKQNITLGIGKNGKCFVKEHTNTNISNFGGWGWVDLKTDTEACHKLYKFHKKYPNLEQCAQKNIFKELSALLETPKGQSPQNMNPQDFEVNTNAWKNANDEITHGLSLPVRLITDSMNKLEACSKLNLDDFVRDASLFQAPIKAPSNLKATKVTPES